MRTRGISPTQRPTRLFSLKRLAKPKGGCAKLNPILTKTPNAVPIAS